MDKLWTSPIPSKPWVVTSLCVCGFVLTIREVLKNSYLEHGDRDSLGTRKVNSDGSLGEYEYIKYKDLYPLVVQLGRSFRKLFPWMQRQDRVGFYGKNSAKLQLYSLAMQSQDQVCVPIYDILSTDAVEYITSHAEVKIIACTEEKLPHLQSILHEGCQIRAVVLLDVSRDSPALAAFTQSINPQVDVILFDDAFCVPLEDPVVESADDWRPSGDSLQYILYTSGTTGRPKGVMIKHSSMLTVSSSFIHNILINGWEVSNEDGVFSYLPLAHGYETAVEMALLIVGARIVYYSGSLRNLLSDLRAGKPTLFIAVPRVLQRIQQEILKNFEARSWFARKVIHWCLWNQTLAWREGKRVWLYDYLVFNKIRDLLGGRLRCLASGAAPLSGELSELLQVCLGVPILEGYGLTETGAACSVTLNNGTVVYYTVGSPLFGHEIKLESIPDMGYTTDDLPHPRGEVLVRGPSMFVGYYKNPELTQKVVDKDGWFHTGDIGQFNEDGSLSIIDRKKSMLKLSQGEYVAVEAVEATFSECNWISQIFIYGNSYENGLVAIAAPNPDMVIPFAQSLGLEVRPMGEEGWVDLLVQACLDKRVVQKVMEELNVFGRRMGLQGFELIKGLYLDGHVSGGMHQIFTMENGMMTPTFKLKRQQCYERYKQTIQDLYEEIHKAALHSFDVCLR